VGVQHQDKLNWLQRALPEGLVADSVWLEKHGYSRSLRQKYVAHGWLDQMARGVYRRPVPKPPANAGHEALSARVEEEFGFAEMPVVSFADLYAGKIVAALDRQHPRDLFDVRGLLSREGIDDTLRKAFIVYLLSHHRPMAEVLAPARLDISVEYKRGFEGMVDEPVALDELLRTREDLIDEIVGKMPEEHRRFLISVKRGEPDWAVLDLPGAQNLPAVRWKLENLAKLSDEKRAQLLAGLNAVLGIQGS
jgi:hypothetical protein